MHERIKLARKAKGLTQKQFAKVSNMGRSAIGMWEVKGNPLPNAKYLIKMAQTLDVSLDWLCLGKGEGPKISKSTQSPNNKGEN